MRAGQETVVTDEPARSAARRPSHARVRLLEVADELFYTDGIVQVGIDRIIAEAGVTKATFYKQYGSKDALILEYITGRDAAVRQALAGLAEDRRSPRTCSPPSWTPSWPTPPGRTSGATRS